MVLAAVWHGNFDFRFHQNAPRRCGSWPPTAVDDLVYTLGGHRADAAKVWQDFAMSDGDGKGRKRRDVVSGNFVTLGAIKIAAAIWASFGSVESQSNKPVEHLATERTGAICLSGHGHQDREQAKCCRKASPDESAMKQADGPEEDSNSDDCGNNRKRPMTFDHEAN